MKKQAADYTYAVSIGTNKKTKDNHAKEKGGKSPFSFLDFSSIRGKNTGKTLSNSFCAKHTILYKMYHYS